MARKPEFKPVSGMVLVDAENPARVVRLVYRFDPRGKDIPAYWVVRNLVTGEETTVQEKGIASRYSVPPETAPSSDVPQPPAPGDDAPVRDVVPGIVTPGTADHVEPPVVTGGQAPADEDAARG